MDPEENADPAAGDTPAGGDATPSMLDAINAALEPTLPAADTSATDTNTDAETDDDESDETGGEDEGDEGAEGDSERNADGTFKAKPKGEAGEGAAKTGAGEQPKIGPDGKPLVDDKGAKKADPVNDPIPEDVKGRTRERMTSLISAVKEKDEMIGIQNQLFDSIKSTGATPQEFGAMLGYMRWVHSDKPEDLKQAQTLLLSELEGLSLKLGEAAPGINFLSKFPDLQESVNNGQITMEHAQELAINRQRQKVQTDQQAAQQTQEQTAQAATAERNAAIAELDALGKTLQQTDPDYARKHAVLQPVLASFGMLPPKQWKAAFTAAYKAIKLPAADAGGSQGAGQGNGGKQSQQPLRANKSPSGSSNRQPTSMLDAVSAAIDAAG